jgi:hypothetical protein
MTKILKANAKIPDDIDDYDWRILFQAAGEREVDGYVESNVAADKPSWVYPNWEDLGLPEPEPATRADVREIVLLHDGENDEEDWFGIFKLGGVRRENYLVISGGCDYTGWD